MDIVHVKLGGPRRFVGWDVAGHGVVMDTFPEYHGEGTGPRPIEVVLYALGGCTGMDVISILEKQRQDVRAFEILVTGEQRDVPPKRYDRIHVEYVVTGRGINTSLLEHAIELSEQKYCSVRGCLDPTIEMTSGYRVVEVDD